MFFGHRLEVLHNLPDKRYHFHPLHLHLHLPVLYLPEIQYLVDQPQHPVGVAFHYFQLFAGIVGQRCVLQHIFHGTGNQCERSTQFVRYVGKEAKLHVRQLLFDGDFVFQPVDGEQDVDGRYHYSKQEEHIQEVGQRRLPEGRLDFYLQCTHIVRPHSVGIGRAYLERIVSFRQIGISGGALRTHIVPRLFEAFQDIGILYLGGSRIVECRVLQGKDVLPVRQYQFAHVVQTLLQHGAIRRRSYILIRNQQFGEYDRRHESTLPYRIGTEKENAVACSKHHLSLRSIGRSRFAETHAERNGLVAVVLEPFIRRHKLADAVLGTHPQVARPVFADGQQYIRWQTVFHTVRLELRLSLSVERQQFVQSAAEGSQIQFVLPGRDNPVHIVVAQAVLIFRNALEVMEHRLIGRLKVVLYDQSTQRSANPDVALTVARDETRLVTVVYGIAFQVVAMVHEHLSTTFVTCQVIDSSTEGSHPDAALLVLVHTIYIVVAQAVNIVFAVTVARQSVLSALRLSLDKAVTLGRYPQTALAVLQEEIDIAFHRFSHGRNGTGLGQIALIYTFFVVHPQLAVFQSYPQVAVTVLADGTHLVAQRLITMCDRSKQAELGRTESYLFQPLGVGTHPQIALTVGKSGMYLIGKAPTTVGQTVVERPQTVGLLVETRESATVWMYPHRSVHILVNVESRTRTVGTGRFYRNNFGLQLTGLRIEVRHSSRDFLFEPDFSRLVTIGRQDRRLRKSGSLIMFSCSGSRIAYKETVCGSSKQQLIPSQTVNGHNP